MMNTYGLYSEYFTLRERVELAACYHYLCDAYDRLLPPHEAYTLSQRNAVDRKRDFSRVASEHGIDGASIHDWNFRHSFRDLQEVARRSKYLSLFGRVGNAEETLRGPVDALGRVAWHERQHDMFRHWLSAAVMIPQRFLFNTDGV